MRSIAAIRLTLLAAAVIAALCLPAVARADRTWPAGAALDVHPSADQSGVARGKVAMEVWWPAAPPGGWHYISVRPTPEPGVFWESPRLAPPVRIILSDRRTYEFGVALDGKSGPAIHASAVTPDTTPPTFRLFSTGGSGCDAFVITPVVVDDPGELPPAPAQMRRRQVAPVVTAWSAWSTAGPFAPGTTFDGTPVTIEVGVRDAAGNEASETHTATGLVGDLTGPGAVPGLTASFPTSASVRLDWGEAPADGQPVVHYAVTGPGGTRTIGPAVRTTTFDGLVPLAGYTFSVQAVDGCGRAGLPSELTTRPDDVTPPSEPILTAALDAATHEVRLTWEPSIDDVALNDYEIERNGVALTRTRATSFVDAGVPDTTRLTYVARAYDTRGNVTASAPVTLTTPDWTAPSVPSGLSVDLGASPPRARWLASNDNVGVDGYELRIDGGAPVSRQVLDGQLAVAPGVHIWQVRAYDAAGNRSEWASLSATVLAKGPAAPAAAAASDVRLVWKGGSARGKTSYTLGGARHARLVLRFRLRQAMAAGAILRLKVRSGNTPITVATARGTLAGKVLGKAAPRRGALSVTLPALKASTINLVLTVKAGTTITVAGAMSGTTLTARPAR